MKVLRLIFLSALFFLSACLFDSDTEEVKEVEKSSSSATAILLSSSSSETTSISSSSIGTTDKSSSSTEVVKFSSSSVSMESSSSQSMDYPYYSSGTFCFSEEGCGSNQSSSSSEIIPTSSSSVVLSSSSSVTISSSTSQLEPIINDGIMIDQRDNQRYGIMALGDKIWMAQYINYATPSGSYCYEDKETNCDVYGRLYTNEAAISVCPNGWHLATRSEYEAAMEMTSFVPSYNGRMSNNSYNFLDGMGFAWVSGSFKEGDKENCNDASGCALVFIQKNPDSDYAADPALFFQKDSKAKGFGVRCVMN